jgi:ribosome biogenesis GTPase / thiamine phosphate phosphatase
MIKTEERTGVIMRTTGSFYRVRDADGNITECTLRGKIRTQELKSTNPLAVGDVVRFTWHADEQTGAISGFEKRKNYILRKSVNLSKQYHILCANVDQALLIATLEEPFTPLGYIDRFLVTCEAYHIPAIIIFNKTDRLITQKLQEKAEAYYAIYRQIGYPVYPFCAESSEYRTQAIEILKNKTTFLGGHSGAGKSTFINLAEPELTLRTGHISESSGKGKHTTTFAEMFPLSFGGYVIDAPGFKEMELYDINKWELSGYFPEMRKYMGACKFNDCTHTQEPGCAVLEALEAGHISDTRYHTYLGMLSAI